jgi:tRNA(Ile)-lysidine synthase
MDLFKQFRENWVEKRFPSGGYKFLLAVSGGMDSMVLADLLREMSLDFALAHCNFQLRGVDSDLDEQLVRDYASKNQVPFYVTRFPTQLASEERKKGIQETARELRYEWLAKVCKEHQVNFILTAHHANDNAETLLMNLLKGTGISGLHGIPEQKGMLIRPLLFALKSEIRAYAEERNIEYREDASNASDKYLRNAVRMHMMPAIERCFPHAVTRLTENIQRFGQAEELFRREVDRQINKLVEIRGQDRYIPVRKLKGVPALDTVFYELFKNFGFSVAQIPGIVQLAGSPSGRFMESSTHKIIKDRDFLILTALTRTETDFIIVDESSGKVSAGPHQLEFSLEGRLDKIPDSPRLAFMDASKLVFPLVLRKWRAGDYFYPLGMGMKKKKLARFLIDLKVPVHEKEGIWVLESGKRILWVVGRRLDERFKISGNTDKMLRVELK